MRLFFIIDKGSYYQPDFIARFIEMTSDEIVGAAIVRKVPRQMSTRSHLLTQRNSLRLNEIAKFGIGKCLYLLKDRLSSKHRGGDFYSVRSVMKFFNIPFFYVDDDINLQKNLELISNKEPDVIISSTSLIFKDVLLSLPKYCCLNRHSSLLPAYGGPEPIFHAYTQGEKYTGVSIHVMEQGIDEGIVLAQQQIEIKPEDTVHSLNVQCFNISPSLLYDAIEKVRSEDCTSVAQNKTKTYYSFPTEEQWKAFRLRGGRYI